MGVSRQRVGGEPADLPGNYPVRLTNLPARTRCRLHAVLGGVDKTGGSYHFLTGCFLHSRSG